MRRHTIASCFILVFATGLFALADDTPSVRAKNGFRFILQPNESKDRLVAVPASENDKPPKHGTIVTCASLRLEKNAIVFIDATFESEGERISATEATVQLDKLSGLDVPWKLSDDFKMKFKTAEAKQRFIQEQTR
jgi:hypothetical protein